MKKLYCLLLLAIFFLFNVYALSDESNIALENIEKAKSDFGLMQERGLPLGRANESLEQALQLYSAQIALEQNGRRADYKLVIEYSSETSRIKVISFKADDELEVFLETYNEASQKTNLSSMQKDYEAIMLSFNEERFEDTLILINEAYPQMSEIESSQTAVLLFYNTVSGSVKNFLIKNWIKIVSGILIILIILFIFWKTINRMLVKHKIKKLQMQKNTLDLLIKKAQKDYFKDKTVSENEFRIKIDRFKEIIRDIDRKIPLLNEKLARLYNNKNDG